MPVKNNWGPAISVEAWICVMVRSSMEPGARSLERGAWSKRTRIAERGVGKADLLISDYDVVPVSYQLGVKE